MDVSQKCPAFSQQRPRQLFNMRDSCPVRLQQEISRLNRVHEDESSEGDACLSLFHSPMVSQVFPLNLSRRARA